MSDTSPNCTHRQFVGEREFCPDCGLSRNEVLLLECAPFLKDDETPAECLRRNRKDVVGCLTMLIAERSKNDALRSERDELIGMREEVLHYQREFHRLRGERDEAVALLREARADYAHAMNDAQIAASAGCNIIEFGLKLSEWLRKIAAIDAFLAADSATHRETPVT